MKRMLLVALVLAFSGLGATIVKHDDAKQPVRLLATPQGCHPVDGDDALTDRDGGGGPGYASGPEQETLDDEGEIACVTDRKFATIRRQLGLAKP